ncbi:hypothetical protein CRU99_06920 [Malaciobacter mytili]|nr:hypothetical protein CRU99_06920 [Malaciobacter mytili]
MEFETNINNKIVTVKLEKKRGLKNCYIRIVNNKMIQIRANNYFNIFDAKELIARKASWIEKHLNSFSKQPLNSDEFYYLGVKHKNLDNRDLDKFYALEAKKIIPPILQECSQLMQLFPTSIKYRKNKRTWGSCNFKNGLNFNTLLVKFPLEVIEYVVIHELAHIKYKNHSKDFWNLVYKYCSDYKKREETLKSFL